jgi:hypothetical protein
VGRISEPVALTKQTRKVIAALSGQLGDLPLPQLMHRADLFQVPWGICSRFLLTGGARS